MLLSLFDGAGTALEALIQECGKPAAALLVENDERIRQLLCHRLHLDGELTREGWQKDYRGIPIKYPCDVWDILAQHNTSILEALSFVQPQGEVVVIAGSPCQDLTTYGGSEGILGFTGPRSVHFHAVYLVLVALHKLGLGDRIFYVVENAGSMLAMHKTYMQQLLGASDSHIKSVEHGSYGHSARNRLFISPLSNIETPVKNASPWEAGWKSYGQLPTVMRSRGRTHSGKVVRSSISYHPHN